MASPRFAVRRIAIIGAGSSGLAAARYLLTQGVFDRIVVYERRPEVGGTWNYNPQPAAEDHIPQESPYMAPDGPVPPPAGAGTATATETPDFSTPMYDVLHVNIPHPLMGFTDAPMADFHRESHPDEPLLIYPARQLIEEYLVHYAQTVRHLIRFNANVDSVRLVPRPVGAQGVDADACTDRWEVRATDLRDATAAPMVEEFDAVVVANGHYDTPYVPAIAGISAFHAAHPGVVTHAKRYRNAAPFRGKRVIVVGNAASGLDIARQIGAVSRHPLYLSVHSPTAADSLARIPGAEEVPAIAEFLDNADSNTNTHTHAVRLVDGRVLRDIDAVVFCTGYLVSLPFLETALPASAEDSRPIPLLTTGRRVHRLYDDLLHIDHPTLAFMCLQMRVVPYPLAQAQAAVLARVWANRLPLPTPAAMLAWERAAEHVRGPSFHAWPVGGDGAYINATYHRIMDDADHPDARTGLAPPLWDDYLLWMRRVSSEAKGRFEDAGATATSLAELGYVYVPDADPESTSPEVL